MAEKKVTSALLGGTGSNSHPEKLHQVEAGEDECPFALCGTQSSAQERKEIQVPLDLTGCPELDLPVRLNGRSRQPQMP